MASAAARRSPLTSVRSEASMATSVPVPIDRPRSTWARAGASLTPSPVIATTRPSAWRLADHVRLLGWQHLGDDLVDADFGGSGPRRNAARGRRLHQRRRGDDDDAPGRAVPANGQASPRSPPLPAAGPPSTAAPRSGLRPHDR